MRTKRDRATPWPPTGRRGESRTAARCAVISVALALGGCGEETSVSADAALLDGPAADGPTAVGATVPLSVQGLVTAMPGAIVPGEGKVLVIWAVAAGSPDYSYKYGEGASSGTSFTLTLPTAPPEEALGDYSPAGLGQLGVGLLSLVPSDFQLPDGRVTDLEAIRAARVGVSRRHAIIWRAGPWEQSELGWPSSFPDGQYACGRCVEDDNDFFDNYEPVDCAEVEILVGDLDTVEPCNWT